MLLPVRWRDGSVQSKVRNATHLCGRGCRTSQIGDIEDVFGEVSSSTLSTRLDGLVETSYLSREQYAEISPRVKYDLTASGKELCQRLEPLLEWARQQDDLP